MMGTKRFHFAKEMGMKTGVSKNFRSMKSIGNLWVKFTFWKNRLFKMEFLEYNELEIQTRLCSLIFVLLLELCCKNVLFVFFYFI